MPEFLEKLMERLPHYRAKYNAAKKIHVYYIPARHRDSGKTLYFYAIASELLHDEMMRCLKDGNIPHFAAVVEKGEGEPTPQVKAKIKAFYGFDHDAAAS